MLGTVVQAARNGRQRRMLVTDDASLAFSWANELKTGLAIGWDDPQVDFKFILTNDIDKVMGQSYDNLLLDLRGSFTANDLGKSIPTVRGGGVIILLVPKFEEWVFSKTSQHKKFVVPPYKLEDVRSLFIPRIVKKLYEHEGIWIHRNDKWEKESREPEQKRKSSPFVPPNHPILGMARTQEQVEVIQKITKLAEGRLVLTADRGRGKSAALGLAVTALRHEDKKLDIIVTSPLRENVTTFFEFLEKGLRAIKVPFSYKNPDLLIGKRIKVQYLPPNHAVGKKCDLLIVDEAAGIPLPLLRTLSATVPSVFSTTVHGYEGAGRTFTLRFVETLKNYKKFTMVEPIRYALGDPIEAWLFDTLLLDAEPDAPVTVKGMKSDFPEPKPLFQNDERLRSIFGLLSSAHYKNTPNDLFMLADAPHHFIQTISDQASKTIGAVHFCFEGGVDFSVFEGMPTEGNIIPDIFSKHYGLTGFFDLKGVRVVRVAAHPELQGKGIGSFAIKKLRPKAQDWLGAVFGASAPLVRFWTKNQLIPVAISPKRHKVSGEFSVVMINPLTEKARALADVAGRQFFSKFLIGLSEVYQDMEPATVLELLGGQSHTVEVNMDPIEVKRLNMFLGGQHFYEMDVDIVYGLVWYYFLTGNHYLSREQELLLISKVLQKRPWSEIEGFTAGDAYDALRATLTKIATNLK
ncbi:MAG: tRNA(Met) cytidine acetyltransferase [Candidatus Altiarchaeota archaeon]|nr:tRNA(Met) cytidine acetyltransferase [Candidatus Altiarchaeota archaeon]